MDEAEEVPDMVFPSGDKAAEVMHPGKEPLHFPASSIAAQFAAILSSAFASASVRRNQFDSIVFSEFRVERVRVVGLVADEPGGEFVEKAYGKNLFHKLTLGRRSALDRYGERKTVISGDSDDLRALAAPGGADCEAPFLALAKVASTNASSRFSRPRSCRCRASIFSASSSFPLRIHCWNLRWQVCTADISPATRAAALRCPVPRTRRSEPPGFHAMDGRGCPHAAAVAAPAPLQPTVRQSIPSVLSRRFAVIPEQPQDRTKSAASYL
jgi:hypothetical protein